MKEQDAPGPERQEAPMDPSLWRGLSQPRLSRRQVLASAGTGAGAMGLAAFLAACGVKGNAAPSGSSPAGGVGTAAWWAKQQLHHTVNFANWPYYLDVLNGKHPSLEHFTQTTGIKATYTEPINDNVAFYAKIRPSLAAKQPTGFDVIVMSDLQELGSIGLLAIGVEPATSTESDWAKAATKLKQQKSDGIVRSYYDQSYISHLKNGDIVVSQAWSGDIFQADLNSKYADLKMMVPEQGMMFWTDNMCIPLYAQNPKDAMVLMDYYYGPQVQAVVEYYN